MIEDLYEGRHANIIAPANDGFEITPSDAADLPMMTRAIYVGGGGTLRVIMAGGGEFATQVHAGTLLPWRIRQVYATGTTATDLIGLV